MTLIKASQVLGDLRARGVQVEAVGDSLRFAPASAVPVLLRERLAGERAWITAILRQESLEEGCGDSECPNSQRCRTCREPDFVRPRAGGVWRCARCRPYDLPATQIDLWPRTELAVPFEARASVSCCACGATARWRRRAEGPWTCRRCHPPLVDVDAIEMSREVAP